MRLTKNFRLVEFIPDHVFNYFGNRSVRFLDERIITTAQLLRDYFDRAMTINNGYQGGCFNYRGFRPHYDLVKMYVKNSDKTSYIFGSAASQHAFGRAIDFHIEGLETEEVRKEIIRLRNEKFPLINGIELDVSWVHVDVRYSQDNSLLMFKPKK